MGLRPKDRELGVLLARALGRHSRSVRGLPGIQDSRCCDTLVQQLVESVRRVRYIGVLRSRRISHCASDPAESCFDPIKAAIVAQRSGLTDEAFWLVFLFVHFGRHARSPWSYARAIYGRFAPDGRRWSWIDVSADPAGFRCWLHAHMDRVKQLPGGFGNHRKYESLDALSERGTGAAVESYVRWVEPPRTHAELVEEVVGGAPGNPKGAFDLLYDSMNVVKRFGRTARFDYLCMLSKLGLAPIQAGSAYMNNATGPVRGARLLFGGDKKAGLSPCDLDVWLAELDDDLGVGMQVLEDALCNWQKNTTRFVPFRS